MKRRIRSKNEKEKKKPWGKTAVATTDCMGNTSGSYVGASCIAE